MTTIFNILGVRPSATTQITDTQPMVDHLFYMVVAPNKRAAFDLVQPCLQGEHCTEAWVAIEQGEIIAYPGTRLTDRLTAGRHQEWVDWQEERKRERRIVWHRFTVTPLQEAA